MYILVGLLAVGLICNLLIRRRREAPHAALATRSIGTNLDQLRSALAERTAQGNITLAGRDHLDFSVRARGMGSLGGVATDRGVARPALSPRKALWHMSSLFEPRHPQAHAR